MKDSFPKFNLENIFRAKFHSLKHQEIVESFENLNMKPDERKSLGVDARLAIDLRVGISFSVQNTSKLARYISKNKNSVDLITYGPCQFPTFWFWYERLQEIKNFKLENFWTPVLYIEVDNQRVELNYKEEKLTSLSEAKEVIKEIINKNSLKVVKVTEQQHKLYKPKPMNTNDLIRMASNCLGFPAVKTK